MSVDTGWREKELSYKQILEKYPDAPKLWVLKIDATRRGVHYTEAAREKIDPGLHDVEPENFAFGGGKRWKSSTPMGLTLRDGSVICDNDRPITKWTYRDPYTLDVVDGRLVLVDEGEVLEEAEFWERPDFYDKVTSNGTPMWKIASVRPQRINIAPQNKCHFWDIPGDGCKFCGLYSAYRSGDPEERGEVYFQDVYETVTECLKQKGRYCSYHMTSGSTLSGEHLFDDEVELNIKTLQAAGRAFRTEKFPVKLVASAYTKDQLRRIYEETGATTYITDLEVLNEKLFSWICPGKSKFVGYQEWKKRLIDAVDIFGRGYVNCGIVAGVEMAQPNGFTDESEALKAILAEAEEIGSHGVSFADCVWNPPPNSIFARQVVPSLDYYVQLGHGLAEIRRKNGLNIYMDDYRRCGNHPNTDLARIDEK